MDLADKLECKKDVMLLTSMMNGTRARQRFNAWALTPVPSAVCRSIGSADRAFKVLSEIKRRGFAPDGKTYGALVASCAEAMLREMSVVHERKDQYVLMERGFQVGR